MNNIPLKLFTPQVMCCPLSITQLEIFGFNTCNRYQVTRKIKEESIIKSGKDKNQYSVSVFQASQYFSKHPYYIRVENTFTVTWTAQLPNSKLSQEAIPSNSVINNAKIHLTNRQKVPFDVIVDITQWWLVDTIFMGIFLNSCLCKASEIKKLPKVPFHKAGS